MQSKPGVASSDTRGVQDVCVCVFCMQQGTFSSVRFNYDPSVSVPAEHYPNVEVEGRSHYKFFRRPIIPFLPQMPPSVVLAPTRSHPHPLSLPHVHTHPISPTQGGPTGPTHRLPATPLTGHGTGLLKPHQCFLCCYGYSRSCTQVHSVGVQTDYRDSEVQTEPYSPEYVLRPGSQPELLTLSKLTHGESVSTDDPSFHALISYSHSPFLVYHVCGGTFLHRERSACWFG